MSATGKRWDQYVQEASKPPFVLQVSNDKTITINTPTAQQVLDSQKITADGGSLADQLRVVCGPAADEVLAVALDAPVPALVALIKDIMAHFDIAVGDQAPDPT